MSLLNVSVAAVASKMNEIPKDDDREADKKETNAN